MSGDDFVAAVEQEENEGISEARSDCDEGSTFLAERFFLQPSLNP